jgi:hypothetical protein
MPTPAAPPPTDDADVNLLLEAAHVPLSVSAAAAALAAGGVVVGLLGAQNLTLVTWIGIYALVPWLLLALGAAAIVVAAKLMHARRWTLVPALALSALMALGAIGFFVISSLSGVFSPLGLIAIAGGVVAIVFTALAIGPFRRVTATRRRLKQAGYDLDL